jgi:hypothetical protein
MVTGQTLILFGYCSLRGVSQLEKNNVNNKKKRNIIIVFLSLIGVMIVLIILNMLMDKVAEIPVKDIIPQKKSVDIATYNYDFYPPDYKTDIMSDADYLDKNRYIEFTNGAISVTIANGAFAEFGKPLVFFNEYFNTIINGDSDTYNGYFTADYYRDKTHIPYEEFTMQRVYEMNVELIQEYLIESGEYYGDTMSIFRVAYKIMKNDGTFRNDMGSDGAVPLLFELIYDVSEDKCVINNITRYNSTLVE